MRGRSEDPDLWGELYNRFRDPSRPPRARSARFGLPSDSRARLLDAALGIVGSIRVFVDVAEDVLVEHRERLGDTAADPGEPRRAERRSPSSRPAGHGSVQDIPMEDA